MICARCPHTKEEHTLYGCSGKPTGFGRRICMCWWFEEGPRSGPEHRWVRSSDGRAPGFTAMEAASSSLAVPANFSRRRLFAMAAGLLGFVFPAGANVKTMKHPPTPGLIIYCEFGGVFKHPEEGITAFGGNCVLHDKNDGATAAAIDVYNGLNGVP